MLAIKLDQGSSVTIEQNLKSWTSGVVNEPIASPLSEIDKVHRRRGSKKLCSGLLKLISILS